MKYLVVTALVVLLIVLLYQRLRPYVRVVQEFFKTLRNFQQMSGRTGAQNQQPEKLVCCVTCGTWVPMGRALGSADVFYCSPECRSELAVKSSRKSRGLS